MIDKTFTAMTDAEITAFIESNEWRFAKSMPTIPHWYAVKDKSPDKDEFVRFAVHVRTRGYERRFYSRVYTYFDFDGFKYWTMDDVAAVAQVINRAKLDTDESHHRGGD